MLAALSIHWFNPLVWLMYAFVNRDLELSCDETVVNKYGDKNKAYYALTLIGLAEKRSSLRPLCNSFSKDALEERVVSIMKMKKTGLTGVLVAAFLACTLAIVFATTAPLASIPVLSAASFTPEIHFNYTLTITNDKVQNAYDNKPFPKGYKERYFSQTKGKDALNVTYDGRNWEPYEPILENEYWFWWNYEEYKAEVDLIKELWTLGKSWSPYGDPPEDIEREITLYTQTLEDIEKGIKVSKRKNIAVLPYEGIDDIAPIYWYCFGYSFKNQCGNEVDLGLYETRDQLFAALKLYYDRESAEGRLTPAEADELYKQIAHSQRFPDEITLGEKMEYISKL